MKELLEFAAIGSVECPHGGCETCVKMCKISPCYGPPEEMQAIIDAGFGGRLSGRMTPTKHLALMPAPKGYEGKEYPAGGGECTFLDEHGKCQLHNIKLKPLMGRLIDCQDHSQMSQDFEDHVGGVVIAEWESELGFNTAKYWLNNLADKEWINEVLAPNKKAQV